MICLNGSLSISSTCPKSSKRLTELRSTVISSRKESPDFCAEAAKAVRYDSDFAWQTEPWPEGEYIVSEKDRNAEKFLFAIAKTK